MRQRSVAQMTTLYTEKVSEPVSVFLCLSVCFYVPYARTKFGMWHPHSFRVVTKGVLQRDRAIRPHTVADGLGSKVQLLQRLFVCCNVRGINSRVTRLMSLYFLLFIVSLVHNNSQQCQ